MEPPAAAEAASPPAPTTVRRNPPRRARPPPTPLTSGKPNPNPKPKPKPSSLSRLLDDEAAPSVPAPHPPASSSDATPTAAASAPAPEERLKVFLRIRPLPVPERQRGKAATRPAAAAKDPRWKPKQAAGGRGGGGVCLVATGPNAVALTVPQSKLVDPKRGRTEVFDGFSAVFSPDTTQLDIFSQVMSPLVHDFLGGRSGLLVAMGPTGSGKTHTIFGSARNPGILPLTLRQIFNAADESKVGKRPTISFSLSIFEILSEGKGERILDLLPDGAECILQQSTIKGLQEVAISNFADAECLVSRGMLRRSTAATNANSNSSRSQCIITIRCVKKSIDGESERSLSSAVLTIADLAGAERERRTGNQGSRLLESNFINNTSMVFGLCLRSLLEHQKNQKKPLEKHFKNSMLTRYLREYLEGRKKMTLILTAKPGDDDYLDTSFLLRQASPYMKIKYVSLDDSSDLISQKRTNVSLICQENRKKRKIHKPQVLTVEGKENTDTDNNINVSERDESQHKFLNSELERVSSSVKLMMSFAWAVWAVLKQYKHKPSDSENAAESMKELIRTKDIQIMELKKELEALKNCCSCNKCLTVEDSFVEEDAAASSGQAAQSLVSLSNKDSTVEEDAVASSGQAARTLISLSNKDSFVEEDAAASSGQAAQSFVSLLSKPDTGSCDDASDNFHLVKEEVSEESICHDPGSSSAHYGLTGESDDCDSSAVFLIDKQEPSSRDFKPEKSCSPDSSGSGFDNGDGNNAELLTSIEVQVTQKEPDRSERFKQTYANSGGETPVSSHSDSPSHQSLTEHHTLPCQKTEKADLSAQITSCSKKASVEQSEEKMEDLSNITGEDIQHDANTRELKHPDTVSSCEQVNSDTEDVSSSQSSLKLQGMVAAQKITEDQDLESKRCEPVIEEAIVEHGHTQSLDCMNDHGRMIPCLPKEITCLDYDSTSKAPNKGCEAEEVADTKKDSFASMPRNTKKAKRRLQPIASMMLKELTVADIDVDIKREGKDQSSSSSSEASVLSDALIQLLKGRPGPVHRARA
ncbi:hypothetical protein ACP4OV_021725 [Aristida adscensionis]